MDGAAIAAEVGALVGRLAPEAGGRAMYGGTMFELVTGDYATAFAGVFVYSAHVSLEFGRGAQMEDALGVLEGAGKARRHIKLRRLADIADKGVEGYLAQAITLARAAQP